ncbi:DUF6843 domain-containing protein [Maribacter sp. 2-571]|uniref:DUF6843 domain-containing protein n=1 Tax=Maribacter sp. 2-571 TaxID=3417569 RepID=UPI003D32AEFA
MAFCGYLYINEPSEDVFIVPQDYRGNITVIYGQKEGAEKEFEGSKRIYRIPKGGVLKTQFRVKGNATSLGTYYYEDDEKRRTPLKTYTSTGPLPDSTAIYVHRMITGISTDATGYTYRFHKAFVGRQNEVP